MQRLGLSHADLMAYHRCLVTPGHQRRILVEVLDLEGNLLARLTPEVLDGQVMIDAKATPTRTLNLTILDPTRSLDFEPNSPGATPLHRSRMIRVYDSRRMPELGDWIDCAIFTGPIWDFDRNGAEVTLVAHGKERLALGNRWSPITYGKKRRKTNVISELMADTGETQMSIPDMKATMPSRMTLTRMDTTWPKVRRLAASMDRQLFYDGRGVLRLRRLPGKPVFRFGIKHLLTPVTLDRNSEGVFNTWEVVGAKPKGSKKRVRDIENLPAAHPLSRRSLGRNGKDYRLVERVENDHIKTKAEAKARAKRLREEHSRVLVTYQFDSLPVAHLDENDLVWVDSDEGLMRMRMEQWSIPLGFDGAPPMTVGDIRRTTPARRGHR